MNLTAKTVAATLALAAALTAGLSAAPALAAPAPVDGPAKISAGADSPTYLSDQKIGQATVNDLNGIKTVTWYSADNWHSYTSAPATSCTKTWTIAEHFGYEGEKFSVTDCKGNKKTFHFLANG